MKPSTRANASDVPYCLPFVGREYSLTSSPQFSRKPLPSLRTSRHSAPLTSVPSRCALYVLIIIHSRQENRRLSETLPSQQLAERLRKRAACLAEEFLPSRRPVARPKVVLSRFEPETQPRANCSLTDSFFLYRSPFFASLTRTSTSSRADCSFGLQSVSA